MPKESFKRQRINQDSLPPTVLAKWPLHILIEGFVPFPKKFLRALHRLFGGDAAIEELAVILAVVDYKRPALTRPPSLERLAFVAGLDPSTFEGALKRLIERRWVDVDSTADNNIEVTLEGLTKEIELATSGVD